MFIVLASALQVRRIPGASKSGHRYRIFDSGFNGNLDADWRFSQKTPPSTISKRQHVNQKCTKRSIHDTVSGRTNRERQFERQNTCVPGRLSVMAITMSSPFSENVSDYGIKCPHVNIPTSQHPRLFEKFANNYPHLAHN